MEHEGNWRVMTSCTFVSLVVVKIDATVVLHSPDHKGHEGAKLLELDFFLIFHVPRV